MLSPPRKRSDTKTPSDDQWHKSQWQQDRWLADLKGANMVKIWSQQGTILKNSSVEHNYYHHQTSAPTTSVSNLDCVQPQGCNRTKFLVTTRWRPLNYQSTRQWRYLRFRKLPESIGHHLQTDGKLATALTIKLQCRTDSNQLSIKTVRGLFVARFVRLFFFFRSRHADLNPGNRHVCRRQSRLNWMNPWFSGAFVH